MDLAEQLVDTWRINDRVNRYLLKQVGEERLMVAPAKGKAVHAQFSHMHSVRLMWLKAAAPAFEAEFGKPDANVDDLTSALESSGKAIERLIESAIENGGRVKGFKPHVTAFVGYLIAHEANHRGQIELALRQAGVPLEDKAAYALWEWGTR